MQKSIYIVPTDTCYGIACEISDVKSYEKIYKMKKRNFDMPLAIMVPNYNWFKENTYLTDEQIDFLKNYIELNKIRYHKKIDIEFSIDIKNKEVKIMPLMFNILVENAFKHGVEGLRDNVFVHVLLKANGNKIYFEIKNNFDSSRKSTAGIGLLNLKNRLKIMYPEQYKLETSCEGEIYKAQLTLII